MTSHDVVGKVRRLAHTRRVGHAGTLDPMATGVLVLGVERATKLLNYLILSTKSYSATIRLGAVTTTDDVEGDVLERRDASGLGTADVERALEAFRGDIMQRPSSVSAIKVDGQRAYALVRAGETVELPARPVHVSRFVILGDARPAPDGCVDVDVEVDCSSGTYIRALARDLGEALGVGGHLTALRRTKVGPFGLEHARTLDELATLEDPIALQLPAAIAVAMPVRHVTEDETRELSFGRFIGTCGIEGTYGAIAPSGEAVALLEETAGRARPVLGFTPAG
jgi:tRNA pseudouridine55 synthase